VVQVEGDRHLRPGLDDPAQRRDREPVAEVEVMGGGEGIGRRRATGCVDRGRVTEEGRAPGLVQGRPGVNPVSEHLPDRGGVVREAQRRLPGRPPAGVLQRLRQVPVVERHDRGDPRLQQGVHEPVVEGGPARLERPAAAWLYPRPRDREAVRPDAEVPHECDVLVPAVVVVGGHVAGVAAACASGGVAEDVPDRLAASVLVHRSFDLVRGGGSAPEEVVR
jgi:hypothetical protein